MRREPLGGNLWAELAARAVAAGRLKLMVLGRACVQETNQTP